MVSPGWADLDRVLQLQEEARQLQAGLARLRNSPAASSARRNAWRTPSTSAARPVA